MTNSDDPVASLRQALELSPENNVLRLLIADQLSTLERFEEAEIEYREALRLDPRNPQVKLALAKNYQRQGKTSQAIVVVEDLVQSPSCPGNAYVYYARLLLGEGDVPNAVAQYKLGIEIDPLAKDEALAERLGISEAYEDEAEVIDGRVRERSGQEFEAPAEVEKPSVDFTSVGGMDKVKEEISMKIIYPLQHRDMFAAYGKKIGGGILMYGPPGCGKTHLARATAGEIDANFISVGISDVLEMWIGSSERNLKAIFNNARVNKPCVLFFDEVDALGARRSDMHGGSGRQLINQFLSELDGVDGDNDGLLILGATNAPWHMDTAFRRPGRFDRVLFVPPPDQPGRASVLKVLLENKPIRDIDYQALAKKTDRFSGADLKAIVEVTVEEKLQQAMRTGVPEPITTKDLLKAIKQVRPSTHEWFATARNHALYSNEGGLYDDVLNYLKIRT